MSVFKKYLLITVLVVSAFILTVSAFSMIVQAQLENLPQWAQDSIYDDVTKLNPDIIKPPPFEDLVFGEGASRCVAQLNFALLVGMTYYEGEPASAMAPHPELLEMVQGYYERIRKDGLAKFSQSELEVFSACAKANSPEGSNEFVSTYKQCADFNAVVLEGITTLQNRRSIDPLMDRLIRSPLDLSSTAYAGMPNTPLEVIGKFSQTVTQKGPEAAQELGHTGLVHVAGCFM